MLRYTEGGVADLDPTVGVLFDHVRKDVAASGDGSGDDNGDVAKDGDGMANGATFTLTLTRDSALGFGLVVRTLEYGARRCTLEDRRSGNHNHGHAREEPIVVLDAHQRLPQGNSSNNNNSGALMTSIEAQPAALTTGVQGGQPPGDCITSSFLVVVGLPKVSFVHSPLRCSWLVVWRCCLCWCLRVFYSGLPTFP